MVNREVKQGFGLLSDENDLKKECMVRKNDFFNLDTLIRGIKEYIREKDSNLSYEITVKGDLKTIKFFTNCFIVRKNFEQLDVTIKELKKYIKKSIYDANYTIKFNIKEI